MATDVRERRSGISSSPPRFPDDTGERPRPGIGRREPRRQIRDRAGEASDFAPTRRRRLLAHGPAPALAEEGAAPEGARRVHRAAAAIVEERAPAFDRDRKSVVEGKSV